MPNSKRIKVTILGSGTSTGVPTIGCRCPICSSNDPRNKRLRASILIELEDGRRLVVDTSPDFRQQVLSQNLDHIDGVLYTHSHADHCHGFDDLRAFYFHTGQPVPCWISTAHAGDIRQRFSYAFQDTSYIGTKPQVDLRTFRDGDNIEVLSETIETIRLPHGGASSTAFKIGAFVYATDFKRFTEQAFTRWRGKIDTMVSSGLHYGTHPSHSCIQETLELFEKLQVRRGVISHLSHKVDHATVEAGLPDYVSLAYDGLSFDVTL